MGIFKLFSGIRKLFFLIIIAALAYLIFNKFGYKSNSDNFLSSEKFIVTRVVDGDTFLLDNNERVRLIGIDTPEKYLSEKMKKDSEKSGKSIEEIKGLGEEASKFVKNLVEGKTILLKRDSKSADRDKYDRLLRYVYLEDGTNINAKIISEGYARAYTKFPFDKKDEFLKLEKEAKTKNKGLWQKGI